MKDFPRQFSKIDGVWLPRDASEPLRYSDGQDTERYLESVLRSATDLSSTSAELNAAVRDWPSRYHLSSERGNLIRAIDIRPDARVLELGCGCGAITRSLAEVATSVTAIEGSPVRARLAALRCRDLDNVAIIAADFQDVSLPEKFDIVTLIGVLEYSAIFGTASGDPFEHVLRLAHRHLADEGVLVVAIENKLGIKYLSGCCEDHLGRHFAGIEGYPDESGPRTFGRAELVALVARCGFQDPQLLLPFPDYKVPSVVINADYCEADAVLRYNVIDWCRQTYQDYGHERQFLFSDHLALASAARSSLLADYANSFLLVAAKSRLGGGSPIPRARWIARKYNTTRKPAYRTVTSVCVGKEGIRVEKQRFSRVCDGESALVRLRTDLDARYIDGAESLSLRMLRALRRVNDAEASFFREVWNWVKFLKESVPAGTEGRLPPEFLDCTPDNVLQDSAGVLHYIDAEWVWHEAVSLDWVVVRGLMGFWFAYRPWIEKVLLPQPYRLHDFLNRILEPIKLTIPPERLAALVALEAEFQHAVMTRSPIDYAALPQTIFQPTRDMALEADARNGTVPAADGSDVHQAADKLAHTIRDCENRALSSALEAVQCARGNTAPSAAQTVYDILIPIYNAYDHVKRCVESVLAHTEPRHPVVLLDDASPDPRILPLLREFAARDGRVRVVTGERNLGFVGNMNRGFGLSRRDVVILNSDTEVTPGWLDRLDRCRRSDSRIGIVSPLSNNATILSVPDMVAANRLPEGMSVTQFAALVAECSPRRYPRLPTAVGFCMLITRETLDRVGAFDTAFGLGYGEESDLCMRAWQTGIESVCCDDAYVHHYGEASFSSVERIDARRRNNAELLAHRWPQYHSAVQTFCHINPLREIQERLRVALERRARPQLPRVLHVIHSFGTPGGTELHTRRIIEGLAGRVHSAVVYPSELAHEWIDMQAQEEAADLRVVRVRKQHTHSAEYFLGHPAGLSNLSIDRGFAQLVAGGEYDIVHFQHLLTWGSLLLPAIAKALGKRVIISVHDYFLLCPEYNLLLPELKRCGMTRLDPASDTCQRCLALKRERLGTGPAVALHEYMTARNSMVERALEAADVLIVPSAFVQRQLLRAFGDGIAAKIRLVEHGVEAPGRSRRPAAGPVLRVGFLGNMIDRKGAYVMLDAAQRLRGQAVRFEVFGGLPNGIKPLAQQGGFVLHGNYTNDELPRLLERVDLVVIPSIWDETYCLTLSEAQALGVPAVASAAGALAERIVEGRTGFLIPPGDGEALARRLLELHADRAALARVAAELAERPVKSMADNVEDYASLYAELVASRPDTDDWLRRLVKGHAADTDRAPTDRGYARWCERQALQPADLQLLLQRAAAWRGQPRIHLVVCVRRAEAAALADTLDAIAQQVYGNWRLTVIADFPAPDQTFGTHEALRWIEHASDAPGIDIVREAARETEAEWVSLLTAGDRLAVEASLLLADYGERDAACHLIYADEDRMDAQGRRSDPKFKPDVNLELLRAQPYLGGLVLVRRATLFALGNYAYGGDAGGFDIALRVIERHGEAAVAHIPRVLLHRAAEREAAWTPVGWQVLAQEIVTAHLARSAVEARVEPGTLPGTCRVRYALSGTPPVSILVIAGNADLSPCLQQLMERTDYPAFEVLAVNAQPLQIADSRLRWVASETDALAVAQGEFIVRLSADTFVLQSDWLVALVAHAQQRAVGVVAPRLVGPDQRLLGMGLTLGLGAEGIAGALHAGLAIDAPGYLGRAQCAQEFSALPRQCFVMRRAHVSEWRAALAQPAPHGEAEFGVRLRSAGVKLVWTPAVTMLCLSGAGRGAGQSVISAADASQLPPAFSVLARDPAFNRNLSLRSTEPMVESELAARWDADRCDALRILGTGFGSPGSWQYRGVQPLRALEQSARAQVLLLGDATGLVRMPNPTELARLAPQVLLLHNTVHDTQIEALRGYRRHEDVTIVFGQDDLMTDLPAKNPFSRTVFRDYKKRLRQCLALSDRLVVTTEPLAAAYRGWIDDIRVVPNYLARAIWQDLHPKRRASRKVRVGWAGAMQHAGDLEWLGDVVRELGGEVEWVFLGMCPEPMRPYLAELHGAVAFGEYPAKLASLALDLALAPLEHNRFNECKSNLRILEYGALGWPVLASDIEPYRGAPVTRLPNNPRAWINAIRERVHDLDAAEQEGERLREWVHAHWMLEDHLHEWLEALSPAGAAQGEAAAPTRRTVGR